MPPDAAQIVVVCQTPRLILRRFTEGDADSILTFRGNSEVMRFSITGPETRRDVQARYLPGCQRRYARDDLGHWAVKRRVDGRCVGECGIGTQEADGSQEFEMSYRLRRDC